MGKPKRQRALAESEAQAVATLVRTSPRKLDLVAGLIRNQPVDRAINSLTFSRKRIAVEVKKTLESAVANAENNHGLDIDQLVVAEASVGKRLVMKRMRPRARGRAGRIHKFFSRLRIVVREQAPATAVEEAA